MEPLAIMDAVPPAILTSSKTPSTGPLKAVNNNNAESSVTMSSLVMAPVMTAQSQSTTTNMMMNYAPPPQQLQSAGIKRPAPFSQSQQQRQRPNQQETKQQHPNPPPFIVNNSIDGTAPNLIDVATTIGQPSTAISSIAPKMNNFNNNNNNTANSTTSKSAYDNTANPNNTFPTTDATTTNINNNNNNNNNNTITPNASTPILTAAEILTPLNREGKNLSEKKIRRLEKNRLSARNCRRKKKEVTQTLQKEINILEGENLRLRLQLKIGAEAEQSSRQEQDRVTEILDALLKSGASDTEIYTNIEEFKEKFADYGRDCRSAIEFHLRNVRRLLMPTTTTNVAMRALRWGVVVSDGAEGDGDSENEDEGDDATAGDEFKLEEEEEEEDGSNSGGGNEVVANMARTISSLKEGLINSQTPPAHPSSIITGAVQACSEANQQRQPQVGVESSIAKKENVDPGNGVTANQTSSKQHPLPTPSTTPPPMPALSDTAALEPKALFQYLVNYLEVTPAQATALKDSRHVSQELDAALATALSMLEELQERLTRCGQDLDEEFSTIRSILTPRQAAKFLVWVANNEACMHMLNELWSKVYPEPIVMPSSTQCGVGGDLAEVVSEDTSDDIGGNGRDNEKG